MAAFILVFCFLFAQLYIKQAIAQYPSVWQKNDPITYFCARWFHQAVVKNDILYVYGGAQSYKLPSTDVESTDNILGFNPMLLQLDLRTSWNWYENISWTSIKPQPNPRTNARPRYAMAGGTMFHGPYNNSQVWTYSGTTFRGNDTMLEANYPGIIGMVTDQYPLWSFDNGSQIWEQYDTTQSITPSYGAATEAPDQGLGFFLHGKADNGTNGQRWYDGDLTTLVSGMMVIDMIHQSTQNLSTSSLKEPQPRIGGLMEYIPNIGRSGVLVAVGGRVFDGKQSLTSADTGRLLNFDSIDVYDIASHQQKEGGIWYSQRTSGDIPPPRIDSCSIVASAPDNSTHNLYVHGGRDPINQTYYDDVYVLSLPSFTWIKLYQATSASGRYGHTCHRVGRQMLTVGGQSVRRNITGMCDWEIASVGILDLPTMSWGSNFDASAQDYELDRTLVQAVGGSSQGGAPRRAPENGWASRTFESLMNVTRIHDNVKGTLQIVDLSPSQSPSPTSLPLATASSGLSKSVRTGVISGTTIFVVVLLSCTAWLIYVHRRRRSLLHASQSASIIEADENPKFELTPEGKKIFEIPGAKMCHEAPDNGLLPELDKENGVIRVSELPATSISELPAINFSELPATSISELPGSNFSELPATNKSEIERCVMPAINIHTKNTCMGENAMDTVLGTMDRQKPKKME